MAFKSVNNHGIDKDIADRMNAKYSVEVEKEVQVWIENVTGITFDKDFGPMLKDGTVLCQLVNTLIPGKIKKVNQSAQLFKQQENITAFIRVCREIGVPEVSLFTTEALAQLKDLNQVLVTIRAFSLQVQRKKEELGVTYSGPMLAPPSKKKVKINTNTGSAAPQKEKKKSKWVIKPGGSSAPSLLNQGSHGIMEQQKYSDPREAIKRKQLDGTGTGEGISALNAGSVGMDNSSSVDAREAIKRGHLDGKGVDNSVSAWSNGSSGMDNSSSVDPREAIKRGQLNGSGVDNSVSQWSNGSPQMDNSSSVDAREKIRRGEL